MPFFKGHYFHYRPNQNIERYIENAVGVSFFSALFTLLPMLLVLLTIGILNYRNIKKGRYVTLFLMIQILMAVLTYIVIQGEVREMDEVFIAGLLISIVSLLTWTVIFLVRKPVQLSRIRDEKLLDEDMEKG